MPIPDYQTCMLPLLQFARDGKDHTLPEATDHIATLFHLSEAERSARIPSGQQTVIGNRVGWARTYLRKAGLLDAPRRGLFRLSDLGRSVLASKPARIDAKFLEQYEVFREFRAFRRKKEGEGAELEAPAAAPADGETPLEALAAAHEDLRRNLESDILEQVKACSPAFFEKVVVELLLKMGYGGTRRDAGRAVGQSHDGGIDGIINEDRLGLDGIYIQAKRWENTVSRPEVQKFAGALQGERARKGVFITTSNFTADARKYVATIDPKIVLIDGRQLAAMMVDCGVGVSVVETYDIKRIDSDFFLEE